MTSLATATVNNSNSRNLLPVKGIFSLRACLSVALLAAGAIVFSSANAAGPRKDPFAGDTWHAVTPSWPGTLVFDGEKKQVQLAPTGADVMEATYSYTIKPNTKPGNTGVVEGTLKMTNKQGQVSESSFTITNDKQLTMKFAGVQSQEHYQRLTAAEQAAEQARLLKMITEGKTKPLR